MHIKKGDKVQVIAGKDKGSQGTVIQVISNKNKVVVEGINIVKRHTKPSQNNPDGGIKEVEAPIHASNVLPLDPKEKVPTRIGYKIVNDKKVRYAKKSGELLDK